MNYKFLTLYLALGAMSVASVDAQNIVNKPKATDNIYIGAGVGAMSVLNDGLNSPTFNFNLKLGKYITPVWGVRAEVGGLWQSLEKQDRGYHSYCKKFAEVNLDATLSLTNLFLKYNEDRKLDLYAFAGPTMNVSKAISYASHTNSEGVTTENYPTGDAKARFGATAGLGLDYNLNNKWAIGLESRFAVTPSVFGWGSDCRNAEATTRLTLGVKYTFGGKKFRPAKEIVEKEVIREVTKEVPVEVVKEVVKEGKSIIANAIFFKIGKADLNDEAKVNIKLMAKAMKQNANTRYQIAGYADKATGSAKFNQTLSEKRAQAVYDALIAEGVSADQLIMSANGGTDNMFYDKARLNRVVILEVK